MTPTTFGFLLMSLTVYANCLEVAYNDIELIPDQQNTQQRAFSVFPKIPNVFDILKKFEMCSLRCKGKYCDCCHTVNMLLLKPKVCAFFSFNPEESKLNLGMNVAGKQLGVAYVDISQVKHVCKEMKSSAGTMEVCVDNDIRTDPANQEWFRVCSTVEASYNGVAAARVKLNCFEVRGDIVMSGEDDGSGKLVADVKILNPVLVATEVSKTLAGAVVGGVTGQRRANTKPIE